MMRRKDHGSPRTVGGMPPSSALYETVVSGLHILMTSKTLLVHSPHLHLHPLCHHNVSPSKLNDAGTVSPGSRTSVYAARGLATGDRARTLAGSSSGNVDGSEPMASGLPPSRTLDGICGSYQSSNRSIDYPFSDPRISAELLGHNMQFVAQGTGMSSFDGSMDQIQSNTAPWMLYDNNNHLQNDLCDGPPSQSHHSLSSEMPRSSDFVGGQIVHNPPTTLSQTLNLTANASSS